MRTLFLYVVADDTPGLLIRNQPLLLYLHHRWYTLSSINPMLIS